MKAKAWHLYGAKDMRLEDIELEAATTTSSSSPPCPRSRKKLLENRSHVYGQQKQKKGKDHEKQKKGKDHGTGKSAAWASTATLALSVACSAFGAELFVTRSVCRPCPAVFVSRTSGPFAPKVRLRLWSAHEKWYK